MKSYKKTQLPFHDKEFSPDEAAIFFNDLSNELFRNNPELSLIISVTVHDPLLHPSSKFPHRYHTMDEAFAQSLRTRRHYIPFRDDWVPYGRFWWQVLDACHLWYRTESTRRHEKILNTDPQLQHYQRVLRHLRHEYRTNRSWYNGDEVSMKGFAYPLISGMVTAPVWFLGWRSGFLAVQHVIHHFYPPFTITPPYNNLWVHMITGLIALISAGILAYHTFKPWWVAGWPWWSSSQRLTHMLKRLDF